MNARLPDGIDGLLPSDYQTAIMTDLKDSNPAYMFPHLRNDATSLSKTNRLLVRFPGHPGDNHYFYLVHEIEGEADDGQVSWYYEVRHGIYLQTCQRKLPMPNPVPMNQKEEFAATLERELKAKEREGYFLVSDTNYSGLVSRWIEDIGLVN